MVLSIIIFLRDGFWFGENRMQWIRIVLYCSFRATSNCQMLSTTNCLVPSWPSRWFHFHTFTAQGVLPSYCHCYCTRRFPVSQRSNTVLICFGNKFSPGWCDDSASTSLQISHHFSLGSERGRPRVAMHTIYLRCSVPSVALVTMVRLYNGL